jgi:hypothetical protein
MNPQGSTKYLSLTPLGIDSPRFLTRKVRYLLLKDEQSVSVLDTEAGDSWVIANADFNRSASSKGSLPCLNSLTIEWLNSHPEQQTYEEPTIERARIYSTEGAWNIRILEVGVVPPPSL